MGVSGGLVLNSSALLDKFLQGAQSRVFRIAQIATGSARMPPDRQTDNTQELVAYRPGIGDGVASISAKTPLSKPHAYGALPPLVLIQIH